MVSKIIALAIAFILMLAVPLYDAIFKPASPVQYGAGDGESKVIETPEQLQELLSNIPNVDTYLENESVLDVYPDFKSFTMTETGFVRNTQTASYNDTTTETISSKSHVLEMCYAVNALYYHAVGQVQSIDTVYSSEGNTGTRMTTSYDLEIYYSSELVMLKFNDFDILQEELTGELIQGYTPVEEEEGDLPISAVVEALEACFGQWMELKMPTEEEMKAKFEGLTEEEQYVEYGVYMIIQSFTTAYIDDINNSNELNAQYLANLASFLTGNVDTAFDKSGNRYELKEDVEVRKTYLNALGVSAGYNLEDPSVEANFTVNSTEVGVTQNWYLSTTSGSNVEMETFTSFKNVDNTIVSLQNAEVENVYDVLNEPFKELVKKMMEEQNNG